MIIVLTGGIGSGKSTAAGIMSDTFGYPVYQADSAVKRLYLTDKNLLADIEADFIDVGSWAWCGEDRTFKTLNDNFEWI